MKIIGIIPARMGSSRFPGKPLASILGMPMIGHVYHRALKSTQLQEVVIATCDPEIADYAATIGAKAVMTGSHHERASDRVAEALLKLEQAQGTRYDVVVLIQGDEPMITPRMIDDATRAVAQDPSVLVANLIAPLETEEEILDPNEIKVVTDLRGDALYFSRSPLPFAKNHQANPLARKQICVVPFKRDFLLQYTKLEPTPLEKQESIDMMRVLEHGLKVRMVPTEALSYSVDTPADLNDAETAMRNDPLVASYLPKARA